MQSYYRIALDDLLGRELTVQWFEGVAIVQGACRQMLADASGERGFPSLAGVYVCANGTIELEGTASPNESVAAAGHALSQMLGEDAPVRLRLVATTAADAGYHTLQEFSDAIAYFERPDAEGILRHLHNRAWDAELGGDIPQEAVQASPQQTSAQPKTAEQPQRSEQAQRSEQPPASEQSQPPRKVNHKWLAAAGIAGAILCAAVWRLPVGSKGTAGSVVATVQDVVRSTLARVAPAEPVANAEPAAKDSAKPERRVARNALAKGPTRGVPDQKTTGEAQGRAGRNVNSLRSGVVPPLFPISPLPMTAFSRPDTVDDAWREEPRAPALYSALDSEVVPPKSVYPKLPAAPPSGFSLPGQTVLEMVIGTNGVVERVKLRSDPRNIHEFMLVSAAKAWQFEPARLHGTPVRYLHTVFLSLQ